MLTVLGGLAETCDSISARLWYLIRVAGSPGNSSEKVRGSLCRTSVCGLRSPATLQRSEKRQLEHRIAAQRVGIIAVLVPGGNHQHAKPDDLRQAVHDLFRRPRVLETGGQAIGQSQSAFDLAQNQQSALRGQPTAIKAGDHDL